MTNESPDNPSRPIMSPDANTPAPTPPPTDDAAPPVDATGFAPPETPKRRASDVLGALSTIEAQLAALKQVQNEQEEEVAKAQGELDERLKNIEAREQDIASKESAFADREAKVKTAADQLTRQRDAIAKERESIEHDRTALKELEQALGEREAQVGEAAKLREQSEQAAKRAEALEGEREELRKQCAELREERDEAMGVMERTSAGIDQLRNEVETLTKQRDEATASAEAAAASSSGAKAEADQLKAGAQEMQSRIAELERAQASAGEQAERASAEAGELRARVEELTRERDEARSSAGASTGLAEGLRADISRLEGDLTKARQTIDELRARPDAPAPPAGPSPEQIEQLVEQRIATARTKWEQELAPEDDSAAQALIADLRAKIAKLESAPKPEPQAGPPSPDTDALKQEVLKRDVAIKALREKLTTASDRITQLESAPPASDDDSPMSGGAMSGAATRAATAKAAEQVSSERTKLSQMSDALAEREAKVQKQAQRIESRAVWARASYTLVALLISFAICAAGSWVGVGQFVEPEFNARAVIEVDDRERPLSDDDRASWQAFHEKLVTDPQLLDKVAERMRTRGVAELASASDLHELIESNMDVTATEPGRLALSLRSQGAQRTERLLETYLSSMVSYSNSTRDLRKDRAATVVITPATAETAPVTDPRMRLFLFAFGGSSALALFIVLSLSRSNRRADQFERETPIELESERRVSVE